MEKDAEGVFHWFDLEAHMVIQGLIADRDKRQLVYVVIECPPAELEWMLDRFPRLVKMGLKQGVEQVAEYA